MMIEYAVIRYHRPCKNHYKLLDNISPISLCRFGSLEQTYTSYYNNFKMYQITS